MSLLTFAPSATVFIVSGYVVEGWNRISVTRNSPVYKQVKGIRGKNTRMRIPDTSAVISLEVQQTSALNEVFSVALNTDNFQRSVRLEILITNTTTSSLFRTGTAYITAYPEYAIENDLGVVKWQIACDECSLQLGGAKSATMGIIEGGVARLKGFTSDVSDQASGFLGS